MTGILAKSSNVGTIMLAREVGDEKLEHYLRAFGLGSRTGIELPGESAGILQASADWTASRAANVPIGQGVSVTDAADGLDLPDHRQRRRSRRAAHRRSRSPRPTAR